MATKKKSVRKKRKATPAQLRALAKGRAARKRNLRGTTKKRRVSKPWSSQNKKRKTVKKTTAKKTTAKKSTSTRKKTGGNYMAKRTGAIGRGAKRFLKKSNAAELMTNASLAVAGGVGSGYLVSRLPITDSKVKSMVPIVTGIMLAGLLGKNKMVMSVSQGMVVLGTVSLFKQLAPTIPMMAGDGTIRLPYSNAARKNNMGRVVRLGIADKRENGMGRVVNLGGNRRMSHERRTYRVS